MVCARCGDDIDPQEGLPVPTTLPDGTSGYLCGKCAAEVREERQGEDRDD